MIQSNPKKGQPRYKAITRNNVTETEAWQHLDRERKESIEVVSAVLPFRTNQYVMDHLIDWDRVPDDPFYQLTFPQRGMLDERGYGRVRDAIFNQMPREEFAELVKELRLALNPHPLDGKLRNLVAKDGLRILQGGQREAPCK